VPAVPSVLANIVTEVPDVPVPKLPDPKPAESKVEESKVAEPKPTSESLPTPRVAAAPAAPAALPTVATSVPTAVVPPTVATPNPTAYGMPLAGSVCLPNQALGAVPALPAGPPPHAVVPANQVAPVRRKVFGSPEMVLSRDHAIQDLFGYDLITEQPARPRDRVGFGEGESIGESLFIQAEMLLWWARQGRIPALATTSTSDTGTGFLGDPNTRTILGPGQFGPDFQTGFRVRVGGWLDSCGNQGFDASYFFLGRGRQTETFDSNRFPTIVRPIFAPNSNSEFGEVVARPGFSAGRLVVDQDSLLWGADVNYKCAICSTCDGGRGWFIGYRHLNLTERLNITEFITALSTDTGDPVGTRVVVGDRFETRNRFHGGQVGYWWQRKMDRFEIDARASVALGVTNHVLDISGFQQRTRPGQSTQPFVGGLLATGPNLGQFRRSSFSVVPEGLVNVGYRLSKNVKIYGGYNFLYWSNVLRPGDQIDRVVDVSLVPNPPVGVPPSGQNRPQPTFTRSDYWAQGIQLGVEFRW
jgi:hypothetical protein